MKKTLIVAIFAALFGLAAGSRINTNSELAYAARIETCNPKCGACSVNVKGTWTYFIQGANNNAVSGPVQLVLSQSGYRVVNTNEASITFVGTVFGNSINFSLTVSGEEIEGYVNFCEGHVLGNKMFAVCNDRDGERTTFTALRAN